MHCCWSWMGREMPLLHVRLEHLWYWYTAVFILWQGISIYEQNHRNIPYCSNIQWEILIPSLWIAMHQYFPWITFHMNWMVKFTYSVPIDHFILKLHTSLPWAMILISLLLSQNERELHHTKSSRLYPGPHLNIKTVLSTYGDFHVKDKTAVRTSYL